MQSFELQSVVDSLLSAIGEAVIVADEQGCILFANQPAFRLFEYSHDELVGHSITRIMPSSEAQHHANFVASYVAGQPAKIIGVGREVDAKNARGEVFPIELNLGEGRVGSQRIFTAIIRDISRQRRHQRELEAFFKRHHESLLVGGTGVWELAVDSGVLTWSNPQLLGGKLWKESFTLEDFLHCVHEHDRDNTRESFSNAQRTLCDSDVTLRILWPEGAIRWLHLQIGVHVKSDGNVERLLGMVQDVTAQHLLQDKLELAKESAEKANLAKTTFLSSVSHELRTPLNAIIGFNQILALQEVGALTEQQQLCVNRIKGAGEHLLDLVDEVLDFTRVESGQCELNVTSCHVNALIFECMTIIDPLAQKSGILINFDVADNYFIYADTTKFKQVLLNLLSNAVKYSGSGKAVEIKVRDGDRGNVVISVLDRGKGIDPCYHERLFLPFDRLGCEGENIEGTGIGLALIKKLMQFMHGEVGYKPRECGGSEFWVSWPSYCFTGDVVDKSENDNYGDADNLRIILLDSNCEDLVVMRYILRSMPNVAVNIVHDLHTLTSKLVEPISTLVILDVDDENRRQALLTSINNYPSVQFVALGRSREFERTVARELAINCTFLRKPVEVGVALAAMKSCVEVVRKYLP